MTETAKNSDIEDVLSSIRRLVADTSDADVSVQAEGGERLVLTPALRVTDPEEPFARIHAEEPSDEDERAESPGDEPGEPESEETFVDENAADEAFEEAAASEGPGFEDADWDGEAGREQDWNVTALDTPAPQAGDAGDDAPDATGDGDVADELVAGDHDADPAGDDRVEETAEADPDPDGDIPPAEAEDDAPEAVTDPDWSGFDGDGQAEDIEPDQATTEPETEAADQDIGDGGGVEPVAPEAVAEDASDIAPVDAEAVTASELPEMEVFEDTDEPDPETEETSPDTMYAEVDEMDHDAPSDDLSADALQDANPDEAVSEAAEAPEEWAEAEAGDDSAAAPEDAAADHADDNADADADADDFAMPLAGFSRLTGLQPAPEPEPNFEPDQGDTDWSDAESVQPALDIAAARQARGEDAAGPGYEDDENADGAMPVFSRAFRREPAFDTDTPASEEAAEAEATSDVADAVSQAIAEIEEMRDEAEAGIEPAAEQGAEETGAVAPITPEAAAPTRGRTAKANITEEGFDADDDGPNLDQIDEEALRDLIAQVVREELQGALGQRITRNVRKMVRREIKLALAAEDFD